MCSVTAAANNPAKSDATMTGCGGSNDRVLSELQYLSYLRDSRPQTRYYLQQWDSLYEEYQCEICEDALARLRGVSLRDAGCIKNLNKVCRTGRYMACVNLRVVETCGRRLPDQNAAAAAAVGTTAVATTYLVHVCNFVPIVLGSRLDLRLRCGGIDLTLAFKLDEILTARVGQVYAFDNFWVFSSFISTDARQAHRYREHTKSTDSSVRMYVYDRAGKGHMLFIRPQDRALHLRDKMRREVRLVDEQGRYIPVPFSNDSNDAGGSGTGETSTVPVEYRKRVLDANAVVHDFARDVLIAPFDGLTPREFFLYCRAYMLHGIGGDRRKDSATMSKADDVGEAVDGDEDDACGKGKLGCQERGIDHLDNKRISSAPALYALLLRSFTRSVYDAVDTTTTSADDTTALNALERLLRACVARYGAMSHRANLLPFISRKTHIRQDWCETMKRQMKSEIRSNRRRRAGPNACTGAITPASGCLTTTSTNAAAAAKEKTATAVERVVAVRVCVPDVGQDHTKVSQQFYCSKLHLDVEYDHELVKRMRVVNLNAMTCLRMPAGFERFLSYYNVGNIGNAGRVMTRTHGMRESYIPQLDRTVARLVHWMRNTYFLASSDFAPRSSTEAAATAADRDDGGCTFADIADAAMSATDNFTLFCVNEVPVMRNRETIAELDDDGRIGDRDGRCCAAATTTAFSLWRFVLAVKYSVPGCAVTVTSLYGKSYCVNVRVAHGIPLCPVNLVGYDGGDDTSTAAIERSRSSARGECYARFCSGCNDYHSASCITLAFDEGHRTEAWARRCRHSRADQTTTTEKTVDDDETRTATTVLPVCREHVWFTRHELTLYYETFRSLSEPRPLMHEIACHGFLSVACYPLSTDISKIIVSINAHRRALDIVARGRGGEDGFGDTQPRTASHEGWARYGDGNGKFTRLVVREPRLLAPPLAATTPPPRRLIPHKAVRLLFAFGDVDMLNCEDGYVLNRDLPLHAETLFRKKIVLSCKSGTTLSLVSKMTLTFERHHGARLHIGTIYSTSRVNVPSGNDVFAYQRTMTRVVQPAAAASTTTSSDVTTVAAGRVFACDVYMVWNQSFVQQPNASHCGMIPPCRTTTVASDPSGGGGDDCLLHEEYEYDEQFSPVAAAGIEVFHRFIRVWMRSRPGQQTLKLQNSFGQKGVAHFADLSDLVTERGEPIDVISSMYSLVGRNACGQLLEQRVEGIRDIYSRASGRRVGVGGYGYFFISNDCTHNHFIYHTRHGGANPMRMCRLTYESLLENCVSSAAYVKGSDFESGITNPYAGMPRTVANALGCYAVHQRALQLRSQRTLALRKRMYDVALLQHLTMTTKQSQPQQEASHHQRKRKAASPSSPSSSPSSSSLADVDVIKRNKT